MAYWYFNNNEFYCTVNEGEPPASDEYTIIKSEIVYNPTKVYGLVQGNIEVIGEADIDHTQPTED